LRARYARHALEAQCRHRSLAEHGQHVGGGRRLEEADQDRAVLERACFVGRRTLHFRDDVAVRERRRERGRDRGAGCGVGAIRERRGRAGVVLDDDARSCLHESPDAVRRKRDSPLPSGGFLGNTNLHSGFLAHARLEGGISGAKGKAERRRAEDKTT
jgi:hypothetical protein